MARGPKGYEVLSPNDVKRYPKLKFLIRDNVVTDKAVISVGRRSVVTVPLKHFRTNDTVDLRQLLSRLEKDAGEKGIDKLQMSLNDDIFKLVDQQEFKSLVNTVPANMCIALTPKVTLITCDEEKVKLVKRYHDDPITGGHSGIRRLYV